ncbi:MAG: hypothetical protein R2939_16250 [Kofleriaceae bacterium]
MRNTTPGSGVYGSVVGVSHRPTARVAIATTTPTTSASTRSARSIHRRSGESVRGCTGSRSW